VARSELATLMGSPDATSFSEPLLTYSANAPTQLLTHVVKLSTHTNSEPLSP